MNVSFNVFAEQELNEARTGVLLFLEDVRQGRPIHARHQFLDLLRPHRYSCKYACLQRRAHEHDSHLLQKRHNAIACGRAAAQESLDYVD